jgi:hypothetical protein
MSALTSDRTRRRLAEAAAAFDDRLRLHHVVDLALGIAEAGYHAVAAEERRCAVILAQPSGELVGIRHVDHRALDGCSTL